MKKYSIKNYVGKILELGHGYVIKLTGKILKKISKDELYIVVIDGGICSQIDQYIVGNYLESLGYRVKYDLSWYEANGRDVLGKQVRNYDLLKLFPYLKISQADKREVEQYCKYYPYWNPWSNPLRNVDKLPKPPRYLAGYGYECVRNKRDVYSQVFKIDLKSVNLDKKNVEMMKIICSEDIAVGMHIRRGDLADGGVDRDFVRKEYFIKAARLFSNASRIFIFSDGMEWVKKELLSNLPENIQLVEINGSDKGWCDLLLLSKCKYQVASQSKIGFHAFLLNENFNKKIYVPDISFSRQMVEFNQIREDEVYYI